MGNIPIVPKGNCTLGMQRTMLLALRLIQWLMSKVYIVSYSYLSLFISRCKDTVIFRKKRKTKNRGTWVKSSILGYYAKKRQANTNKSNKWKKKLYHLQKLIKYKPFLICRCLYFVRQKSFGFNVFYKSKK